MSYIKPKHITLTALLFLNACGGGGSSSDNSSSQSERDAFECIETNTVERGGSTSSFIDPTTGETINLSVPGRLTTNITNSCDFDVNSIDSDGNRFFIPKKRTINTGGLNLIISSCKAPFKPENTEFSSPCIE